MDSNTHSNAARRVSEYKSRLSKNAQEQRRALALAEQKKRRTEKIESSRNIDLFAGLSISSPNSNQLNEDEEDEDDDIVVPQGLAQFASMLGPASPELQLPTSFGSTSIVHSKRRGKKKSKSKKNADDGDEMEIEEHASRLANAVMYAELLEMNSDLIEWPIISVSSVPDGIPTDIETGWVALAPIPRATRTLLHSRVKGKAFLTFPSPLPPDSILDCLLDDNWQQTGIIHVVDILRWRGSDFTDCETEFRFWWRDAKLSEVKPLAVPNPPKPKISTSDVPSSSTSPGTTPSPPQLFPYPITFLAVPYFAPPLTLPSFLSTLIPAARSARQIPIQVPVPKPPRRQRNKGKGKKKTLDLDTTNEADVMEIQPSYSSALNRSSPTTIPIQPNNNLPSNARSRPETAEIASDGIILYVSQASYQPGETPLACWIPSIHVTAGSPSGPSSSRTPLDIFEALIYRRCAAAAAAVGAPNSVADAPSLSTSQN